jgi:hypothetical protein
MTARLRIWDSLTSANPENSHYNERAFSRGPLVDGSRLLVIENLAIFSEGIQYELNTAGDSQFLVNLK